MTPPEQGRADAVASLVASVQATVKAQHERGAALAALARVKALITDWQGGTGHTDGNKFVSIADLKAALDPTEGDAP